MGAVYRAEDTRLDREVAIKVLPEAFTADAERLARFEREAKVLASLNHPNIAGIYEVDEADGVHFLAMELAEGEDLADRMARGSVPADEALAIALQIAEGLEAAHERGIVHRDLKPANVKITPTGQVKILDFGLAKAWEGPSEVSPDVTASPTLTAQMTQAGVILGTAAYMSPEQARGEEADQRADVWAFGVILFEMLTGEQLFREPTVSDTLAAVLRAELELDALPDDTPWRVRDVLGRCLDRDPKQRLHSIADARIELSATDDPPGRIGETEPQPRRSKPAHRLAWALAAVLAVLLAISLLDSPATPESGRVVRFDVELPEGTTLSHSGLAVALSPDGEQLVLEADAGPQTRLYLRRFDDPDLVEIPGTEAATSPFFSPDGKWLGFTLARRLKKISLDTFTVIDLAEAGFGAGDWSSDGSIVYTPEYTSGLWRISENGGEPEQLTSPDPERKELGHFWPQSLPGGRRILFTSFKPPLEETRIEALDLEDGSRKILVENACHGRYLDSGHLIFVRQQTLFAAPFDPDSLELGSAPEPVLPDIAVNEGQGNAYLSSTTDGTLAFVRSSVLDPDSWLTWVDRTGKEELATQEMRQFSDPAISPDGQRVAVAVRKYDRDIWLLDLARGTLVRMTDNPTSEFNPFWAPDGKTLLFNFDTPPFDIYRMTADGGDQPERAWASPGDKTIDSISRHGEVLFDEFSDGETSLWSLSLTADGEPRRVHRSRYALDQATFSPDGRWIVFESAESGRLEIYVKRASERAAKTQVSLDGGTDPLWSPAGDEIFYRRGDQMLTAPIRTEPELSIGRPEVLFERPYRTSTTGSMYDVDDDGRFLMVKVPPGSEARKVSIILNFDTLLERLFPLVGVSPSAP